MTKDRPMIDAAQKPQNPFGSREIYDRAWRLYGARCLWNVQRVDPPTPAALKAVASALRKRGDRTAAEMGDLLQAMADAA
jgi:hypothetical protein